MEHAHLARPGPMKEPGDAELMALCEWASGLSLADIPATIISRVALVGADTLACAAAAASDPEARTWAGRPQGKLRGAVEPEPPRAARTQAILANWWQLDEGHHEVMCHAGLYCVPAAWAECRATGSGVPELLRGVAAGYEITCRLARAWAFETRVPHPHAVWSAIGSAATLGVLRRLPASQLFNAVQLAATLAGAPPFEMATRGELAANTWAGLGVEQGFLCVSWAEAGLHAAPCAFRDMFQTGLGAARTPVRLQEGLGRSWAIEGNYHKVLACGGQAHAAIEALLQARANAPDGAAGNPGVRIQAHVHAFALRMSDRTPTSSLGARFSIPHLLAVVWIYGRTDPQALGAEFLEDPAVARLREAIELVERRPGPPPPWHRGAQVDVLLLDGRTVQGECPAALGSPGRPLGSAQIAAKCKALAPDDHDGWIDALLKVGNPAP